MRFWSIIVAASLVALALFACQTGPTPAVTEPSTVGPTNSPSSPAPSPSPTTLPPTPPASPAPTASSTPTASPDSATRFAVIGDYGDGSAREREAADLVRSWKPDFIITTGDNNYPGGAAGTIDRNIGQFYHDFIAPYTGTFGAGAQTNRFFPSLGNHDWISSRAKPYLDYFTLPGNERYYDFSWGAVHLFALDSQPDEPDGVTSTSTQAEWLRAGLAESRSCWNVVYFHHSPFSSGMHGSNAWMQWPFQKWGADAIFSGHDHTYERIVVDGLPYFVDGIGGATHYVFGNPIPHSQFRYNARPGAMLVTATRTTLSFELVVAGGETVDRYELTGGCKS